MLTLSLASLSPRPWDREGLIRTHAVRASRVLGGLRACHGLEAYVLCDLAKPTVHAHGDHVGGCRAIPQVLGVRC